MSNVESYLLKTVDQYQSKNRTPRLFYLLVNIGAKLQLEAALSVCLSVSLYAINALLHYIMYAVYHNGSINFYYNNLCLILKYYNNVNFKNI